jgi:subtilisin family serine protease
MNRKILLLLIIGLFFGNSLIYAQTQLNQKNNFEKVDEDKPEIIPGKIIVKFKENSAILAKSPKQKMMTLQGMLPTNIENLAAPYENIFDSKFEDKFGIERIHEIEVLENVDILNLINYFNNREDVEYAEPVYARYISAVEPNDPGYATQYAPKITDCPRAWDLTTGEGVLIAIVDNGVFYNHPDLEANMWVNEADPVDGIDNDNNGYVDDYRGWDFVGNSNGQQFYPDNDPKPTDSGVSHGTHVAGCAAAVGNNNIGVIGPAFNAKIMPVKIGPDNPQTMAVYEGYKGILYAAKMGADIINCSWGGGGYTQSEKEIIDQALSYGSIILAAAGNEAKPMEYYAQYPAMYEGVISIGASNSDDEVAESFTNYGWYNCIYAPGEQIYSTFPTVGYEKQNGTSMACPVASGIAALIKSIHPEYTWKEMYHQLRSTSEDVFSGDGVDKDDLRMLYFGRVNAYHATYFNNPNIEADPMPGISISELVIDDGAEYISTYEEHDITLRIKNYLGDAENLQIEIVAYDSFIELEYELVSTAVFASKEEMTIPVKATLNEMNPWHEGSARVLVKYKADNGYDDLEMIEIPISMESVNSTNILTPIPSFYYAGAVNAYSPDFNSCWIAGYYYNGYGPLFAVIEANQFNFNTPQGFYYEYFTSVYAFDSKHGIFGTSRGNLAVSTNGGNSFEKTNLTHITGFINDVAFLNKTHGVVIGKPMNGKFGIGYTTDGGVSWLASNDSPEASGNETPVSGAFDFNKEGSVWFGTSTGRVFRSRDGGQKWSAGKKIHADGKVAALAFLDENNGLALYSVKSGGEATTIAATSNGGYIWKKNVFDFEDIKQLPISIFAPEGSEYIFIHMKNGCIYRTKDLGETWEPILSEKSSLADVSTASFNVEESQGRVFSAGGNLSIQNFDYSEPEPAVDYMGVNPFVFDTTLIGKSKIKTFKFENTGNTILTIEEVTITLDNAEEGEFETVMPPAGSIYPGENITVRVRFKPTHEGNRTAVLKFTASEMEIEVDMSGVGEEEEIDVSVNEVDFVAELSAEITPNPVSEKAVLSYELNKMTNMNIKLYNEIGELVKVIFEGKSSQGLNQVSFDCTNLVSGVYIIRLTDGKTAITRKIVVEQ